MFFDKFESMSCCLLLSAIVKKVGGVENTWPITRGIYYLYSTLPDILQIPLIFHLLMLCSMNQFNLHTSSALNNHCIELQPGAT